MNLAVVQVKFYYEILLDCGLRYLTGYAML